MIIRADLLTKAVLTRPYSTHRQWQICMFWHLTWFQDERRPAQAHKHARRQARHLRVRAQHISIIPLYYIQSSSPRVYSDRLHLYQNSKRSVRCIQYLSIHLICTVRFYTNCVRRHNILTMMNKSWLKFFMIYNKTQGFPTFSYEIFGEMSTYLGKTLNTLKPRFDHACRKPISPHDFRISIRSGFRKSQLSCVFATCHVAQWPVLRHTATLPHRWGRATVRKYRQKNNRWRRTGHLWHEQLVFVLFLSTMK